MVDSPGLNADIVNGAGAGVTEAAGEADVLELRVPAALGKDIFMVEWGRCSSMSWCLDSNCWTSRGTADQWPVVCVSGNCRMCCGGRNFSRSWQLEGEIVRALTHCVPACGSSILLELLDARQWRSYVLLPMPLVLAGSLAGVFPGL